jgi:ribonuclease PH
LRRPGSARREAGCPRLRRPPSRRRNPGDPITGACVALRIAVGKLAAEGKIPLSAFTGTVAAISVGIRGGTVLTDLDYDEDSSCDVDMNFVMTEKGEFVEIQGTAEHAAFTRAQMDSMTDAASAALSRIRALQAEIISKHV